MDVGAWCGHCGESFRLAETVDGGYSGRCPRCGRALSPAYDEVASPAVHDVLRSAAALTSALARLGDVAPRLHVDVPAMCAELTGSG